MPLISAATIIRSLSLLHLTIAYFLLTSPSKIANYSLVFILGSSMGIPSTSAFSSPSAVTAFLAAALGLLGITDLTVASLREEVSSFYWSSQAPIRFLFFFALTTYTYVSKPGGPASGPNVARKVLAAGSGYGERLSNSVVFTWAFVEMITWFWIYVTLRDERREAVAKAAEKRMLEEERSKAF